MDGNSNSIPIISRVLADGTLIETLYDPAQATTSLAIAASDTAPIIAPDHVLPSGLRLIPYEPDNNLLAHECVLLPSAIGEVGSKEQLVADIASYLHHYVDLTPEFEAMAAHYVLLSWVYDAFNELPYLRFQGDFGTGKTRALLTIGSICYKPFFASGASTVSPIFHILDAFGGTLVLDEADFRFSDATADIAKILNNGNVRGLPVLRTMANRHKELNPRAFRVFGPKLIGMRERFSDIALESRFLSERTGNRPLRSDIPLHLPGAQAAEARNLRNRLLAWRFAARCHVRIDPASRMGGVSARLNQVAMPLLSLVDDPGVRAMLANWLVAEARAGSSGSVPFSERAVVSAMRDAFACLSVPYVTIDDIARRTNAASAEFQLPLSNKSVGAIVRRLGVATTKTRGVYVVGQDARERVDALVERFALFPMSTPDAGANAHSIGKIPPAANEPSLE
ncbi:hypothetical protein [Sphingomonas sp.]|uniref:hypothetical protein n=1 Tax=Sphingomonas sp. TaxID=28214 RepID=UPI003F6E8DC9